MIEDLNNQVKDLNLENDQLALKLKKEDLNTKNMLFKVMELELANENLLADKKRFQNYEFLYEEEKFSKI